MWFWLKVSNLGVRLKLLGMDLSEQISMSSGFFVPSGVPGMEGVFGVLASCELANSLHSLVSEDPFRSLYDCDVCEVGGSSTSLSFGVVGDCVFACDGHQLPRSVEWENDSSVCSAMKDVGRYIFGSLGFWLLAGWTWAAEKLGPCVDMVIRALVTLVGWSELIGNN
ncbi:hypothetical protein OGAPHI_001526 [Ogataea philodendri]|uniref:Uncharacterized protein n=1 Tax=Ogataea philodendri TaxID=1378263 RepID=A0A9P8PCY6_9ASCO|nr:uncharacterized protein OGAPHI_001526 [Ogataea philodendri]KAH3669405.1 hypothetical protein OGAPHI_001526 [Ogataea philodendri]